MGTVASRSRCRVEGRRVAGGNRCICPPSSREAPGQNRLGNLKKTVIGRFKRFFKVEMQKTQESELAFLGFSLGYLAICRQPTYNRLFLEVTVQ